MHESDPKLIAACQNGSQKAWDELVDRYGRLVYSIPRRYGYGDQDCDEIFQRVFLILFRKLDTLNDQARLSAWLITTTQRECWRLKRREPDHGTLPASAESHEISAEDRAELWEQQHLVREALQRLGGRCEQLLTALFLQSSEASYETIAKKLGMKVGSIGPTRARCFEKMQKILLEMGFRDPVRSSS